MAITADVEIPYPILKGRIFVASNSIKTSDAEGVCLLIVDMLSRARAHDVKKIGNSVYFKAGMFRSGVWSTNILLPFSTGCISVIKENSVFQVAYIASTREILFVSAIMASFFFALSTFAGTTGAVPPLMGLKLGFIALVWFYGGNYTLGAFRFPNWLREGLQGTDGNTEYT